MRIEHFSILAIAAIYRLLITMVLLDFEIRKVAIKSNEDLNETVKEIEKIVNSDKYL